MRAIKILRFILLPIAGIYNLATSIRNSLYDRNILTAHSFNVPIICIGNIRVGGTGKTPFVEFLISAFADRYNISILSRGYGRHTKGFIKAKTSSSSKTIGDEPLQYFLKYAASVQVYVQENRPEGIRNILKDNKKTDLIILDDAYQHRPLKATCNIVLTEFSRPFFNDLVLPAGRLRESRRGIDRADFIIVTKCPYPLEENRKSLFKKIVYRYAKSDVPVYFTRIVYGTPVRLFETETNFEGECIVLTGIDNPIPFINYCYEHFSVKSVISFKDHHSFSDKDIEMIRSYNLPILTTEKDAVRLRDWEREVKNTPVFYLPIKIDFLEGADDFLHSLDRKIGQTKI